MTDNPVWPRSSTSFTDLPGTLGGALSIDVLYEQYESSFIGFLQQQGISQSVLPQFKHVFLPMACWLLCRHDKQPLFIGLNGAQGSGKSTLSQILKLIFEQVFHKSVLVLSIDDLYLSRAQRQQLAHDVHPLFEVRGVPGTHNMELAKQIFKQLKSFQPDVELKLPRFDKSQDDLLSIEQWPNLESPVDMVLFEGWCVGAIAQQSVDEPVNDLELIEDTQAVWRNTVNQHLAEDYADVFAQLDYLIMLKVPDMESIFEWRNLQERKLEKKLKDKGVSGMGLMSEKEISRFIMYYERITRHTLSEMPERADITLSLNKEHQIDKIRIKDIE